MPEERTTNIVQRYLSELHDAGGDVPSEALVRELLGRSAKRLRLLCASLLYRSYPRLARPPLNLDPDEMLGSVVERLMKALRQVRPQSVRQFFALANQHMRWELNDLARRLDAHAPMANLDDRVVSAPSEHSDPSLSADARRMLAAIDKLPDDEREAFSLVRIQGMSQPDAAEVLGVSSKTIQRRLIRSVAILAHELDDLRPQDPDVTVRPSNCS